MLSRDRRFGVRVPFEMFLDHYVGDRRHRALTSNISETGVFLSTPSGRRSRALRRGTVVAMELNLPGVEESIWACGVVCSTQAEDLVVGTGIRFTGMTRRDARRLRDFCVEQRREHLSGLLAAIREPALQAA